MIALAIAGSIATAPASPQPFTPSGLVVQRVPLKLQIERRQVVGARHRVVHERAGQHLAGFRIVDRVLQQRLADALRDRAMRLAGGDHRIDQHAVIVHRRQPHQRDRAGIAIDLDLHDMRAVGEGHVLARPRVIGVERRAGLARPRGHVQQRDRAIGADDSEVSVGECDVGFRRLQRIGGDRPCPSRTIVSDARQIAVPPM